MTVTPRPIHELELFSDCTKSELRLIRSLTTFLELPKGQVLMRQGDAGREFIIVGSGIVHISRETEDGTARVADVGSGDFLGEIALLSGVPRTATATAATDVSVLVSSIGEFRSILHAVPSVEEKVRRASVARTVGVGIAA
jgi:trk system potassium uptake protein TrkA